jgi:hypothetical protein
MSDSKAMEIIVACKANLLDGMSARTSGETQYNRLEE